MDNPISSEQSTQITPSLKTNSLKKTIAFFILGNIVIAFVAGSVGYMIAKKQSQTITVKNGTALPSSILPSPTSFIPVVVEAPNDKSYPVIADGNAVYLSYWGIFSAGEINTEKHTYTLFISYPDQSLAGRKKVVFMKNVSLENKPENIESNGKRFFFRFVGPGDGQIDYVANVIPPFNIKTYQLPNNFSTGLSTTPLTWIDDKRILYRQSEGLQNPSTWTYWITNIDDTSKKQEVTL